MPRRRRILELSGLLVALCGGQALAQPAASREMSLGQPAPPPVGYVDFCRREPADCASAGGQASQVQFDRAYWSLAFRADPPYRVAPPASIRRPPGARAAVAGAAPAFQASAAPGKARKIALTKDAFAELERVNRDVNGRIVPARDRYGKHADDRWELPLTRGDGRGDCEDYVLEKRHELIRLGYPQEALSIALVRTRWNESHAVLVVETTAGAYVLDSYSPWVAPWSEAPYRWVVRQSPDNPALWVEVAG